MTGRKRKRMKNNYDLVYADPPWKQKKGGFRRSRPRQGSSLDYATLSLKDIEDILSGFHAPVLFMWTIDKFLREAEDIGRRMGYKLHSRLIWDKGNGIAPAFTVRFAHEYLLWFYQSPMIPIAHAFRGKYTTVIRENATVHSKKPIAAYEFIENIYPWTTKIELFARNKREGWDCFGNETSKFPKQKVPISDE